MKSLSLLAATISIFSFCIYFRETKNSLVKPNRWSWLIWSFSTILETLTYNGISLDFYKKLSFFVGSFSCIVITILIWYNSVWKKPQKEEIFVTIFCVLSICIWYLFGDILFAHILTLIALPVAFIPTLENISKDYKNEDTISWCLWSISDLLICIVAFYRLEDIKELAYPIIEFLCHLIVFSYLSYFKYRSKNPIF